MAHFYDPINKRGRILDTKITKGYDLKVTGACSEEIAELGVEKVGFSLADFRYLKPKVLLKEGDTVKKGQAVICDKSNPEVVLVSPVNGTIEEIKRGDRRVLLNLVINKTGDEAEAYEKLSVENIQSLDDEGARKALLSRGLWPYLIRRPYHTTARVEDKPVAIYVNCMNSNPLNAKPSFYLKDRMDDFKFGVELLKRICPTIHICVDGDDPQSSIFSAPGCEVHRFSGKHPKGNLSVHIENIDPIVTLEKVIWSISAQDLVAMGKTLSSGEFDSDRVIAWVGPAAKERKYYKTVLCASAAALPKEEGEIRMVSGNILSGRKMDAGSWIGYFDDTVLAIKEGRERRLFGWLTPGPTSHSLTKCYLSNIAGPKEYNMTTTTNGEHRALVDSEMFDKVQPLDVHTIFLFKALLAEDIEESERLGLWSVAPEDFALATYMDPSKNDFGGALQKVIDMLHKEEVQSAAH